MEKEGILKDLASQFGVPIQIFEEACKKSNPVNGIPTLSLIEKGAVLGAYANYLNFGGDNYEPCEFKTVQFLEEGAIGLEEKVPVSYSRRGKIIEN